MSDSSVHKGPTLQDVSADAPGPYSNPEVCKPTYSYSRTYSGSTSSGHQAGGIIAGISRHSTERPYLSISGQNSNLIQPVSTGSDRHPLDHSRQLSARLSAPMMEGSSTSPVVQIPPWFNKARSPVFAHHSPGLQVKLSAQGRMSPIDAVRSSNHPYPKNKPVMNSASSSRRGSVPSASLASGDSDCNGNRNVPTSSGLKDSPRRKRRPDFPTSPRSIVRREGDDYAMDSPLDYTQTPSILRVPFTPIPPGMQLASPDPRMDPRSARLDPYAAPGSALPTSSLRDSSPGKAVSSGSTRQAARTSALPRDRPRTESIPRSYVLKSLNNLAPHFWNRPATADCRISKSKVGANLGHD